MTSRVLGGDDTGQGEVLLCIHGFPLDRTLWRHQVRELSKTRRVLAPDLRGRGASPLQVGEAAAWSLDDLTDDLVATLDAKGIERVDVMGLSMGGYVAFAFLRRYASRVRSLTLVNTKADADTAEGKTGRTDTAHRILARGMAPLADGMISKLLASRATPELHDGVRAMFLATPPETAAADALAMRDRPDSTPDLAAIAVPTLVIHGEHDALMPAAGAHAMAHRIPNARFVVIPGAGHLSPLEQPEAVNAVLGLFMLHCNTGHSL
ncbi:MAG: alpha/beta fold hydrolase [Myxococcota bacterium]